MMDYINRFSYELALHLWDEADLIMEDDFFMCSWIQFASILLSIFSSMLMSEIGLQFSFLVESLCGFGIRVTVTS